MENETAKACCKSGKPVGDCYVPKGQEINLSPDLKIYQVGSGNKHSVILVYDVFGFDITQTRRFADLLSENSLNVVMADHFRGKPWSLVNFPPADFTELLKWIEVAGSYSIVEKDLTLVRDHLHKTGAQGKPSILGFCWGGKMASRACQTDLYHCGVSIHGAFISPELVSDITVPMMYLPASDDPSLDEVEKVLNTKPFGKDCVYHRFNNMKHGFAAARGDWNDVETREAILKAVSMSQSFISKFSS